MTDTTTTTTPGAKKTIPAKADAPKKRGITEKDVKRFGLDPSVYGFKKSSK